MGKQFRTIGLGVTALAIAVAAAFSASAGVSKTMTVDYEPGSLSEPVALSETTMEANYFTLPDGQGLTCLEEQKATQGTGRGCVVTTEPAVNAQTLEQASYELTYLEVDGITVSCLAYGATRSVTNCFEYAPLN